MADAYHAFARIFCTVVNLMAAPQSSSPTVVSFDDPLFFFRGFYLSFCMLSVLLGAC